MGCSATKSGLSVAEDKELDEYLSKEDIQLVRTTWRHIQDDMEGVGFQIFQRFFAQNKSMRKLFCTKLAKSETDSYEKLMELEFDDRKIRSHGYIVMEALGAAIECMGDSDQLTILLIGIGERHVMYGVSKDMVPLLWPAITKTFEEVLGEHYTPRVSVAWERLFHYIGGKVIEGIARWRTKLKTKF